LGLFGLRRRLELRHWLRLGPRLSFKLRFRLILRLRRRHRLGLGLSLGKIR
jgi:hypothetical protein